MNTATPLTDLTMVVPDREQGEGFTQETVMSASWLVRLLPAAFTMATCTGAITTFTTAPVIELCTVRRRLVSVSVVVLPLLVAGFTLFQYSSHSFCFLSFSYLSQK